MNEETPRRPDRLTTDVSADHAAPATTNSGEDTRIEVELDLDNYVLEWFRAQGDNYEVLMNQVLHDYIATQEEAASQAEPESKGR